MKRRRHPKSSPPALSVRERALAGLPEEFGHAEVRSFLRAFQVAANRHRRLSRGLVRPGGTKLLRRRVAKLMLRGRGAVEIALELGFSLQFIDRVVTGLKNPQRLMNPKKLKALAAAKNRVAQLEKSIATDLERELASLPPQFGFTSVASFVTAVKAAVWRKQGSPPKRKRGVITAATRRDIRKLVKSGKAGAQIAKRLGISTSSVQIAKRAMRLTKKA